MHDLSATTTGMCSLAAAVQGMDETVNNGAQTLYLKVIGPTITLRPVEILRNAPATQCVVVRRWREILAPNDRLPNRNNRRRPLSCLCHTWLLAYGAAQQCLCSSRNHLHLLLYCCRCFYLGR